MKNYIAYCSPFSSWIFIISAFVFSVNQLLILGGISNWFTNSYLDDLLVLPIFYTLSEVVIRVVTKNPLFRLEFGMLVTGFVLFSVAFEVVLPRFSNQYTADAVDVLSYLIGGLVYVFANSKQKNIIV